MANITGTAGNDTRTGTANADTITGLGGNDTLSGLGGNDRLDGGTGNDTLNGGLGVDLLIGGAGNDTYTIDNATEINKGTTDAGIDTVRSSANYTLGAQQENLTLTGTAVNGSGNALGNIIIGNASANTLKGLGGNDRLEGGGGNDKLEGGAGNDTYVINVATEINKTTTDAGTDTVQSSVAYTLGAQQEHLTLTGTANLNGSGNNVANTIIGNTGKNVLSGLNGNDTLDGGNGNDTLNGGAGNDTQSGGAGNDTLNGGADDDRLLGGGRNDTIVFDAADTRGVDGGDDTDVLKVNGEGASADLATLNGGETAKFLNFEFIDLTATGTQTVLLSDTAVQNLNAETLTISILGTSDDVVQAAGDWVRGSDVLDGETTFHVWTKGEATIRVQDGVDDSSFERAPVGVDDAGTGFSTDEDSTFTTGNVLTNDTDANNDALTVSGADTTSTAGAAITNNSDGTFGYNPGSLFDALAVGETDTDTFTYTVSDGHGTTDTATVTIVINGANDAVSADDDAVSVDEGDGPTDITTLVLTGDADPDSSDTLSITAFSAGDMSGLAALVSGSLAYSPNGAFESLGVGDSATDTFTYTVSDGHGTTDTATVTVTVHGENDAVTAGDDVVSVNEDATTVNLANETWLLSNDTDIDANDVLFIDGVAGGSKGTVTFDAGTGTAGDETVTYTADGSVLDALADGETTTDTFFYAVSDGHGTTDTATVTVTITGENDANDAVDDTLSVDEDDGVADISSAVLANDDDIDTNDVQAIIETGGEPTGTVTMGEGTLSYTAAGNFDSLAEGETTTDSFTYTISDGHGTTDTATVTVTITGENDAVNADDDTLSVDEDDGVADISSAVLANDDDVDSSDVKSITATGGTPTGAVTLESGVLSYNPNGQFESLAEGETTTDSFTYTISDGHGSTDTATVTVTITGENDANDAVNDNLAFDEDDTTLDVTATLLSNDDDIDTNDVQSITATSGTPTGEVTLVSGVLSYNPDGAFESLADGETTTDSFTYTISDGHGSTDTATVTVTITGENDANDAVDDTLSVDEDDGVADISSAVLANDDDIDTNDVQAIIETGGEPTGTVTMGEGTLSYTAAGNFDSLAEGETTTDSFTYTISDGHGTTDTATVTVTITGENDTPTGASNTVTTDEDVAYVFEAVDFGFGDADSGDSLTAVRIDTLPGNGVLKLDGVAVEDDDVILVADIVAGDLTFAPGQNDNGDDYASFTFSVRDEQNAFDAAPNTMTIDVDAVNDAPVNTVPGAQTFGWSLQTGVVQISVADGDLGANDIQITLSTSIGSLTLGSTDSITFTSGDGTDDTSMTFKGTLTAVNAAMAATYFEIGVPGSGTITVVSNDLGSTGSGGSLTDTDTVGVSVPAVLELSALDGAFGFRVLDGQSFGKSGFSVSDAGDVNGDGFEDVIIGSSAGFGSAGFALVVFGDPSFASPTLFGSLNGTDGFRVFGIDGSDYAGKSVSSAGDVNGDGYADLVIGAPGGDPNGTSSGESYVVFGGSSFDSSLSLSSLNGTNGFRLDGIDVGDYSGRSVSSAGDMNGDGYADFVIGAPFAAPNGVGSGESYVVFGGSSFDSALTLSALNGINGFRLDGVALSDFSGQSVSSAGDVNGDGYGDIIIGAFRANQPGNDTGASYVVFGGGSFDSALVLSALNGSNGFRVDGIDNFDQSGRSVSSAGDVNGDGYMDLIIGASAANGSRGESYVVFGSSSSFNSDLDLSALNGTNGFRLDGIDPGDQSGYSVSSAGDINGDGYDDLLVGAYGADRNNDNSNYAFTGETYVVFGGGSFGSALALSALNGANGFRLDGVDDLDKGSFSVSAAGDLNGDGFDDFIIGAPDAEDFPNPPNINSGESYIIFGRDFRNEAAFVGGDGNDSFTGTAAAEILIGGLGNDLLDGAAGADALNGGAGNDFLTFDLADIEVDGGTGTDTAVLAGTGVTLDLTDPEINRLSDIEVIDLGGNGNTLEFDALSVLNQSGTSNTLRVLGDASDSVVAMVAQGEGVWTYEGTQDIGGIDFATYRFGTAELQVQEGIAVSGAAAVPEIDLASLDGTNGFRLAGIDASDQAGVSVAGIGDFNGDGFADLLIGAYRADPNGDSNAGESYVVFGSSAGFASSVALSSLNGTDGFRLDGVTGNDYTGKWVAGAGDVNGDGFAELIIGAPTRTFGNSDPGQVYVLFGDDAAFASSLDLATLNGSNGFRLDGVNSYGYEATGHTVDSAGDINGDGFADLIIGMLNSGYPYAGAAYVVFGQGGGFASVIDLATLNGNNGFRIPGTAPYDFAGQAVSGAGDVNGDGFDDLLIGGSGRTDTSGGYDAGVSFVVFGKSSGFGADFSLASVDGTNGLRISGEAAYDYSGRFVSGAGDVNGDGYADLILGVVNTVTDANASYVIFGKSGGFDANLDLSALNGTNGFQISGVAVGDQAGYSVSGAGDVNGDGYDDLLIGANTADPNGTSSGAAYLVFGSGDGFVSNIDLSALNGMDGFQISGISSSDFAGRSVSAAGDLDGDGFDDLLVGAYKADGSAASSGAGYVIFGRDFFNDIAFLGSSADDDFTGTAADETLIGGQGDDTLDGGADNDILIGGSGNDFLVYDADDALRVDGGLGEDTLIVNGDLDLTALNVNANYVLLTGFEAIDLVAGTGSNTLTLDTADLLRLSDNSNTLLLMGDDDDAVIAATSGVWTEMGNVVLDSETYAKYTIGEAVLLVDADIDRSGISLVPDGTDATVTTDEDVDYVFEAADFGFIDPNTSDTLLAVRINTLPGQGVLRLDGNAVSVNAVIAVADITAGELTFDPDNNENGDDYATFTFSVQDSAGNFDPTPNTMTIDVDAVNDAPVNTVPGAQTASFLQNKTIGGISIADLDLDANPIEVTLSTDQGSLSLSGVSGLTFGDGDGADDSTMTFSGTLANVNTALNNIVFHATQSGAATITLISDDQGNTGSGGAAVDTDTISVTVNAIVPLGTLHGGNGFRLDGIDASGYSGSSVAGAGDVNGDGFADVIIGAYKADPSAGSNAGESYVVFGKAGGFASVLDLAALNGSNGFRLDGVDAADESGRSVAGAGDVNGDGIGDLIIGAWRADSNEGESYVVFGDSGGFASSLDLGTLNGNDGFRLDAVDLGDFSGSFVASAGDVNGDGYDDVIVGAKGANGQTGESYVVFGKAGGFASFLDLQLLDGTTGFRLNGIDTTDTSQGIAVASAGDLNGDGYDDLIIGADQADPNSDTSAGESYVVFGKSAFLSALDLSALVGSNGFRLDGIDGSDQSGRSVASAGDVNGDGFDDVIIGAYRGDPNGDSDAGESYVVFGTAGAFASFLDLGALNGTNGFRLDGIDVNDFSGYSVSSAGDVNGDGFDDLLIGAWNAAFPPFSYTGGETYVVYGKAGGFTSSFELSTLNGTNGFRLEGINAGDNSGTSVAGAGDFDGDGFDDLIIGAKVGDHIYGPVNAGESYIIFGGDFRSEAEFVGGAGNDTHTGTGADDLIIGGQGDDTLDGGAGNDVLIGGSGNDFLVYDADDELRVDGGLGEDTLTVNGDLDLTALNVNANYMLLTGFEAIDLVAGTGNNTLTLDAADLLQLSDTNTLRVMGDDGDAIVAAGVWTPLSNVVIDSQTYAQYTLGAALLQVDVDIELLPAGADDTVTTDEDTPYVFMAADFGFSDANSGDTFTAVRIDTLPTDGVLELNSSPVSANDIIMVADINTGDLTFTPDANENGDDYASFTFSVRSSDGIFDPAPNTMTIDVDAVNDAPLNTVPGGQSATLLQNKVIAGVSISDDSGSEDIEITLSVDKGSLSLSQVTGLAFDGIADGVDDQSMTFTGTLAEVNAALNNFVYHATETTGTATITLTSDDLGNTGSGGAATDTDTISVSVATTLTLSILDGANGFRLDGIDATDYSGRSVSDAGDVNGDGFGDIIIGAYAADPVSVAEGESYVVFGKSGGFASGIDLGALNGNDGFRVDGVDFAGYFGWSVSSAGDMNGDGFADLLIGARRAAAGATDTGKSYVVFGTGSFASDFDVSNLNGSNGFRLDGIDATDYSGRSVSDAGDVNGDGFGDIIIGADRADAGGSSSGESYVVFGAAAGFASVIGLSTLDGTNGFRVDGIDINDSSGISVSGAGDVNGDGFADLIIGATGGDANYDTNAGESYVVFGRSTFISELDLSALGGSLGFRLDGVDAYDFSGRSVSSAGDVNGDGLDDLIIGALANSSATGAGRTYVVFGKTSFGAEFELEALNGTNGFRLDGEGNGDSSSYTVSSAGDVNGDGFDDLLIGSAAPFATRVGTTYLVFGGSSFISEIDLSSLNGSNGFKVVGIDNSDFSGQSVSSAGDVDGDGFDDLLIGGLRADPNGDSAAGESYVIFGSDFRGEIEFRGGDDNDTLTGTGANEQLVGEAGNDTLNGGGGNDVLTGGAGNDTLNGDAGTDFLRGGTGVDTLNGGDNNDRLEGDEGADTLDGGLGNDTLEGGSGNDIFVFNDATGATNVDVVEDFGGAGATALDLVHLENAIFGALTATGPLDAGRFVSGVGPTPGDADDHILYDTSTGELFYDPTGDTTGGDAVLIAVFATDADGLSASDFVVI